MGHIVHVDNINNFVYLYYPLVFGCVNVEQTEVLCSEAEQSADVVDSDTICSHHSSPEIQAQKLEGELLNAHIARENCFAIIAGCCHRPRLCWITTRDSLCRSRIPGHRDR